MRRFFNNTNLLIVAIAVVGASAGFLAGGWLRQPPVPQASAPVAVQIGDQRPDLVLPDPDDHPRHLSEWDGKFVLLNFWATWCAPCRAEMPLLERLQQRHGKDGLQVVGIAIDDAPAVHGFLAAHAVGYPILIDAPDTAIDASQKFGNDRSVLPYSVLIGPDRRILARRFGSFSARSLDQWLEPHFVHRP